MRVQMWWWTLCARSVLQASAASFDCRHGCERKWHVACHQVPQSLQIQRLDGSHRGGAAGPVRGLFGLLILNGCPSSALHRA
jgi:hypothetical protein